MVNSWIEYYAKALQQRLNVCERVRECLVDFSREKRRDKK